ncbi:hypothetical protein [Actinomadura rugatobispora]|uniref:Uncharacterized protein n=1 Tax=Actinomadura rugatobispora TaxID=1994 RepID=A0ABW1AGV2_9ACTN|nr:hypothetical protein GCM10010200_046690 [Actinomadura rugatobispora]
MPDHGLVHRFQAHERRRREPVGGIVTGLHRLACDYVIGELGPEALPSIAAEALARGVDSLALRELAGCNASDDVRDIRDLYLAAMAELEIPMPDADSVLWEKVRLWARCMVEATVSPYEGASQIERYGVALGSPQEIGDIPYLMALWAEYPARRRELEISMVEEARSLLPRPEEAG